MPQTTEATPKKREGWRTRFLAALEKGIGVASACRAAKINRQYAYKVRSEEPEFAEQWQDALNNCLDDLEKAAVARAKRSSDTLLIFLLKSHRRATYGDKVTLGGDPDAPLFKVLGGVDPDEV